MAEHGAEVWSQMTTIREVRRGGRGEARHGPVWLGRVGCGTAWRGGGVAWLGSVRWSVARPGLVRRGRDEFGGVRIEFGWVRRGTARRGVARQGQVGSGSVGLGTVRRGREQDKAGWGKAWMGVAGRGEVRRGLERRGGTATNRPSTNNTNSERKSRAMAPKKNTAVETVDDAIEQRFGIELPYTMNLRLRGVTPFLFNRMDIEAYDRDSGPGAKRKPRSRPGYETMIWRNDDGELAYPGANVVASIVAAGKYFKSPIASNGSATPTLREGLVPAGELGRFLVPSSNGKVDGLVDWDCIDFRHARHGDRKGTPKPTYRPRLEVGWCLAVSFSVTTPELWGPAKLLEIISRAGTVMGIGDGRKIGFGRYVTDGHEVQDGLPW